MDHQPAAAQPEGISQNLGHGLLILRRKRAGQRGERLGIEPASNLHRFEEFAVGLVKLDIVAGLILRNPVAIHRGRLDQSLAGQDADFLAVGFHGADRKAFKQILDVAGFAGLASLHLAGAGAEGPQQASDHGAQGLGLGNVRRVALDIRKIGEGNPAKHIFQLLRPLVEQVAQRVAVKLGRHGALRPHVARFLHPRHNPPVQVVRGLWIAGMEVLVNLLLHLDRHGFQEQIPAAVDFRPKFKCSTVGRNHVAHLEFVGPHLGRVDRSGAHQERLEYEVAVVIEAVHFEARGHRQQFIQEILQPLLVFAPEGRIAKGPRNIVADLLHHAVDRRRDQSLVAPVVQHGRLGARSVKLQLVHPAAEPSAIPLLGSR